MRPLAHRSAVSIALCVWFFAVNGCQSPGVPEMPTLSDAANSAEVAAVLNDADKEAITTNIADAVPDHSLPEGFGDNRQPVSFNVLPKDRNGISLLFPGFYEMTFRTFCLRFGKHGPTKGGGYLYAPLKGPRKEIIEALIRNSARKHVSQDTTQMLIWSVLAKVAYKDLPQELRNVAAELLTPAQALQMNGGALNVLPKSVVAQATASLPASVKKAIELENEIRQLYASASTTYQDLERLAVPQAQIAETEYPDGQWSKHPGGYFIRYFTTYFRRTRVQVYVPNALYATAASVSEARPTKPTEHPLFTDPLRYYAAADVAQPAANTEQRVGQGSVPADHNPDLGPLSDANYDPCRVSDPKDRHRLTSVEQAQARGITDAEDALAHEVNKFQAGATEFDSPDAAARAALYSIIKRSVAGNTPFAGRIYKDPKTDHFQFSEPKAASPRGKAEPDSSAVPPGSEVVGTYLTRGGEYYDIDETFSPEFLQKLTSGHQAAYLGTPRGKVVKYDPAEKSACAATANSGAIAQI